MQTIKMTPLENGLRVITDAVDSVDSIALGVWIGSGSRYENKNNNGAAHMVEHMLFKGTETRDAQQIVSDIESVGGQMNAYTSRDITSYHMHLMADHTSIAMDVLSDMVLRSTLRDEEVERERKVIIQEIGMTMDTPDDLVFDLAQETAYHDQSFGRSILGQVSNIEAMSRDMLVDFIDKQYTPNNMVLSAAGKVDHNEFVAMARDMFGDMSIKPRTDYQPAKYNGGDHREAKELEQTHVVMGFEGVSRDNDDYYAAQMLGAILGGGMSSRLFQEVRELRGLAYSVYAYHAASSDTGQFGIYAGTDPTKSDELIHVLCEQAKSLTSTISESEISRARHQMKSSLAMSRESMMTRANGQAKYLLQRDKILDQRDILQQIDAVEAADISRIADRIFSTVPALTTLGDISNVTQYDRVVDKMR